MFPGSLRGQGPELIRTSFAVDTSGMSDLKYGDASCVIPIDPGGSLVPLFLVHGADGDVEYAHALAGLLPAQQPVWGVRMEGFASHPPPRRSIEDLAGRYVSELRAARPSGPYALGGYSIGGTIAFEMVRQLEAAGEEVSLIALIDARFPPLPDVPGAEKSYQAVGVWPRPRRGWIERIWRRQVSDRVKRLIVSACVRFQRPLPSLWSIRTRYFWKALAAARDEYRPGPVRAPLLVVGADGTGDVHASTWGVLSETESHIVVLAGTHLELVGELYLHELALTVKNAIARSVSAG